MSMSVETASKQMVSETSESASIDMNGSNKTTSMEYSIVAVSNRDGDRVIDFLRRFFFRDEPLNVCVGLLDTPDDTCGELEQYCVDSIPDGVSLMAVSPSGNLLGVCVNGILTRDAKEEKDEADECSNPKFRKILNLLSTVCRESDVFKHYPEVDKVLDIRVASVDDACRGHGIAKALFDRSKSLARELDIPLVRVDCTSHYSAKAVARLGFHCIYTLLYSDHKDCEGHPVFTPELPHTCVKTFVFPVAAQ